LERNRILNYLQLSRKIRLINNRPSRPNMSQYVLMKEKAEQSHVSFSEISGSHGGKYEDESLLGYCTV
jgi:hypothetical protein